MQPASTGPEANGRPGWTRLSPPSHWDWHIPTPFSQGWRVGALVLVGGQLSADAHGNPIGLGDIETQTRNVFENISRVLAAAGADWRHVVRLNTYYAFDGPDDELVDYWERMTRVRLEFLDDPGPAATAVRVKGFMYDGFLIEADAIAVVGNG